jgi:hypothetical protein
MSIWDMSVSSKLQTATDFLLPKFSELHYITLFVSALSVIALWDEAGSFLKDVVRSPDAWLIVIGLGVLTAAVIRRRRLKDQTKLIVCVFYYGLFAFLALIALDANTMPPNATALQIVNYWLVVALLTVSVLRGLIVFVAARVEVQDLHKSVTRNFDDTQYRLRGFLLATTLSFITTLILSHHYDSRAQVIVLATFYANTALLVLSPLIKTKLVAR